MRRTVDFSIVEDAEASDALDNAIEVWREKALGAWERITWAIMDNPEVGHPLNEAGSVRFVEYPGSLEQKEPTITVLYQRTAPNQLTIRAAKFEHAIYAKAGSA